MKRFLYLTLSLFLINTCYSQVSIKPPIYVKTAITKNKLELDIQFINSSNKPLLLWMGRWVVDYINPTKYNYSSIAAPIKFTIYLMQKNDKISFSEYVLPNNEDAFLLSSNYKLINETDTFFIKLNLSDSLVKQITKKNLQIYIQYTILDATNFIAYLERNKLDSGFIKNNLYDFLNENKYFFQNKYTSFNLINWASPQSVKIQLDKKLRHDLPLTMKPQRKPNFYIPEKINQAYFHINKEALYRFMETHSIIIDL